MRAVSLLLALGVYCCCCCYAKHTLKLPNTHPSPKHTLPAVRSQPVMKNLLAAIEYYGATIFFNYVSTCGLNSTLQNMQENLTVFAPANTAFETLPSTTLKKLETDFNFACETIKFHISPGPVSLTANNTLYPTMSGYNIRVNIYTSPNITTVSGSTLLLTNNTAQNGVLNVLGKVMYPVPTGSALSLVIDSSNFTILLLALAKAGLTPVLDQQDVTVLAPTDEAFQVLQPNVIEALFNNITLLNDVLMNHIIQGVWYSAYFLAAHGGSMTSMDGQQLNVAVAANNLTITISQAAVTQADVSVTNGVVHVIDRVLLPTEVREKLE